MWRVLKEFPNYEVSTNGEVRSLTHRAGTKLYKGRTLKQYLNKTTGYCYVSVLGKGNRYETRLVHRLVAMAFLPNPNNLREVNHKNGIKTDNRVENLEWVSRESNIRHAFANGLISKENMSKSCSIKKPVQVLENGVVVQECGSVKEMGRKKGIRPQYIKWLCEKSKSHIYRNQFYRYTEK